MANGQPKPLSVTNVVSSLEPGNGQSENSSAHGGIAELDITTGSINQGSVDGRSSRLSVDGGKDDDFELLWRLRKYLLLLAILAVNVTYNAGLTPPGGFWQKNEDAGDPVLQSEFPKRYDVFFYFNATALSASLVLIILLLSKSVTRQKLWLRSMQFTMILDLFSMMGAYAAGSCRALKSSIYILVLVIAVSIYVGIHILVFIRIIPEKLIQNVQKKLIQFLCKCGVSSSEEMSIRQEEDVEESSCQEKDGEESRKFILTLVIFAATITYQAGLSPPGGFWAENILLSNEPLSLPRYKYLPATSVLRSKNLLRYNIFVTCNSTSFVASLVTIILLLSPELSKHGIRSKALNVCVVVDLLFLIGAYAAGCCRDLATSLYVMFIIIIVSLSVAFLAGIFLYKPVADWLQKFKLGGLRCMSVLSSLLSFQHGSKRSSNEEHENSCASRQQGAAAVEGSSEPEHPYEDNQRVSNAKDGEEESREEHPPADNQQISSIDILCNSQHPSGSNQRSANTKDVVLILEHQSTGVMLIANTKEAMNRASHEEHLPADTEVMCNSQHPSENNQLAVNTKDVVLTLEHHCSTNEQLIANMEEAMTTTELPALSSHQTADSKDGAPAENQQFASTKEQSDDQKSTAMPVEGLYVANIPITDCNGAPGDITPRVEPSVPVEAHCAEQRTFVVDDDRITETDDIINDAKPIENGHIDNDKRTPNQNGDVNTIEKHLIKTRTYLLLLAILAVSLTYQSGMNPPGGFWSKSEDYLGKHHSAGDRILEDLGHPRFISFFYLNAVAFVASIVMIIMLLNKKMSEKVTKRRALQITMIVDLLSLTGSFVMGSSREAKKSIYISVLACLLLAYVIIHVLIAIHVIPPMWKTQLSKKLNGFSCRYIWAALPQFNHRKREVTTEKELQRRRNLLLTLAILAATVTYQAGINPPGSVWSDDKNIRGIPGNPILQDTHSKRYDVFYYSNSVSFMSSVVITILLVNKESCEHGIKSYALRVCLVAGLLGLLIAYVAGSCRNKKQSIYLIIMAVAVLISLVIQVLLSSMHDTLGRPLSQCLGSLQRLLFHGNNRTWHKLTSKVSKDSDCDEKTVRKRHKYLMLLAILAASITYQAGLNPPGGFWSADEGNDVAGNSILHDINHQRYKTFFCFNSFSFMASIVVIMLLLSKSIRKKDVPLEALHLIMILDLLALMTSFAAGSCRKFWTSVYVYALVICVAVYLVLVTVLSNGVAMFLKTKRSENTSAGASRTQIVVP